MTATEILSTDESDLELVRSASSQESSKKKSSKRKKKDSKKLSSSSKNKQARLSVPGASFSKWDKKTSKPLHDAPWPSRGLQHVYGPGASTLDKICTSSFTTRVPNHPADALPGPSTALQHFAHSTSFEQPSSNAESSNNKRPDIQNTDALTSRLLADIPSSDLPPFSPISTHFSSLYAPSKAEQVLGSTSRESATFLRDWLEELQLRPASDTSNHPTILRQVDPVSRKRQRRSGYASDNDLADFIDDGPIADDWMPSSSQAAPMANGGKFRFDPLTNLILLSGPISSGKTCSVYATAKELGYAVFEVSPNQPRGFKDLLAAVGEVGRNHLVWKSNKHEQHIKKGGVMDFFQNAAAKSKEKGKDKATDQNGESGNTVQQSLILIEEVDILFPDDKSHGSFWDGVIQIVSRSHRPVVLTCNDSSKIPFDRLALQAVLEFSPPTPQEVTPFFQAVALHQGHLLSPATAQQLYCPQFQALRHPPLSTSNRPPTSLCRPQPQSGDLRHGLSQLQLLCSRQSDQTQWCPIQRRTLLQQQDHREEIAPTGPDDLKQSYKALEALSSVNAFIDRRENLLRATYDRDGSIPIEQRELEYDYLDIKPTTLGPGGLPYYILDEEIAFTIEDLTHRVYNGVSLNTWDVIERLMSERRNQALLSLDTASSFLSLAAPLPPSPDLITDYAPAILALTHFDDLHESAFKCAITSDQSTSSSPVVVRKRQTRRSRRIHANEPEVYQRYMEFLSEEQLTEARTLRKRFDAESESDRLLPPACSTRPVEDTEEET